MTPERLNEIECCVAECGDGYADWLKSAERLQKLVPFAQELITELRRARAALDAMERGR